MPLGTVPFGTVFWLLVAFRYWVAGRWGDLLSFCDILRRYQLGCQQVSLLRYIQLLAYTNKITIFVIEFFEVFVT